jgi:hypothetical protein
MILASHERKALEGAAQSFGGDNAALLSKTSRSRDRLG